MIASPFEKLRQPLQRRGALRIPGQSWTTAYSPKRHHLRRRHHDDTFSNPATYRCNGSDHQELHPDKLFNYIIDLGSFSHIQLSKDTAEINASRIGKIIE